MVNFVTTTCAESRPGGVRFCGFHGTMVEKKAGFYHAIQLSPGHGLLPWHHRGVGDCRIHLKCIDLSIQLWNSPDNLLQIAVSP